MSSGVWIIVKPYLVILSNSQVVNKSLVIGEPDSECTYKSGYDSGRNAQRGAL